MWGVSFPRATATWSPVASWTATLLGWNAPSRPCMQIWTKPLPLEDSAPGSWQHGLLLHETEAILSDARNFQTNFKLLM